jgi:hypothetical protein
MIKKTPPSGVINTTHLIELNASVYKLPLKHTIPSEKQAADNPRGSEGARIDMQARPISARA